MARRYKSRTSFSNRSRGIRRKQQRSARSYAVTRARRRSGWRNRAFRSMSLMGRNPFTMNRVSTLLRYNTVISLDPKPAALGGTGSNTWQFSANGLYDPDITSTGHQPLFYDNYTNLYKRYHVKYSTITVTVVNHFVNTATANSGGTVTLQPNYSYKLFILKDATNGVTNEMPGYIPQIIEAGGSNIKWRFVAPSLIGKLPKLKMGCSPHRLSNKSFRDDTLLANSDVNPSQGVYYYIGITSADGVTDPPSVYLNVDIKYYVDFFDRIAAQNEQ